MTQKIILVGGGYAGTRLAHGLGAVADVTLVEPRDAFVHNVAAIRAVVSPELLDRLVVPYDRLLKTGTVVQARAKAIGERQVVLEDGRTLDGDIVVAATGSTYAQPFKPQSDAIDTFRSELLETHAAVDAAQTIAIIGAGPVGVEMAAEIAAARPGKSVTLLAASEDLVPGISSKLSRALMPQLAALGIQIRLGTPVEGLRQTDRPFQGELRVGGEDISADLVIPALGAKPVLPPVTNGRAGPSGRLSVDGWLRPAGYEHVFSLGDAADTGEPMTIVAIRRQVAWLLRTLKAVLAGKPVERLAPYRPATKPFLLVPVGPDSGSSIFPLTREGYLAGPWITRKIKGQDLFIHSTRKELGYS